MQGLPLHPILEPGSLPLADGRALVRRVRLLHLVDNKSSPIRELTKGPIVKHKEPVITFRPTVAFAVGVY